MSGYRSLKSQFLRTFLSLSLLPILLFGIISVWIIQHQFSSQIHKQNTLVVETVEDEVRTLSRTVTDLLVHAGYMAREGSPGMSAELIRDNLETFIRNQRSFSRIYILDREGIIMHAAPEGERFSGMNMSNQEYFTELSPSSAGETYWSSSFISGQTGRPSVAASLVSGNYIVVGFIDLSFLNSIIGTITIDETGFAFITDRKGTLIAYPDRTLVYRQRNIRSLIETEKKLQPIPEARQYTDRSEQRIVSVIKEPHTGWTIGLMQERREAYSTIFFLITILAIAVTITAGLALISAFLNKRRLFTPISDIIEVSRAIAEGRYQRPTPRENTIWELHELAGTIDSMGEAIRRREEALQKSEREYRQLVEDVNSIIIRWDTQLRLTFVNSYARNFFGYSEEELLGHSLAGTLIPSREGSGRDLTRMLEDITVHPHNYLSNENEAQKKNGERVWIQWSNRPIYNEAGELSEILSVGNDRTSHKLIEKQINESLKEKEILLKEIHHRVKNNLQVISSLLNLQATHVRNKNDYELFRESQLRVQSMALIHEQLYQSKDFALIGFGEYIRDLIGFLCDSYNINPKDITFHIHAEGIYFSIDYAIPCALIINELASNAIKHGFPPERLTSAGNTNTIEITVFELEDCYTLTIDDNGVGMPDELDIEDPSSMGLQLVKILAEQLSGSLSFESNHDGTMATITLPKTEESNQ
jgi:PAS domain S-box-containing protein